MAMRNAFGGLHAERAYETRSKLLAQTSEQVGCAWIATFGARKAVLFSWSVGKIRRVAIKTALGCRRMLLLLSVTQPGHAIADCQLPIAD